MIHIKKDNTSNIYVTFTELMEDTSNWVLIKIESEMTKDISTQYFLLKYNYSIHKRYDVYKITEQTDDLDPVNAIINIPSTGNWIYTAYEYDKNLVDPTDPTDGILRFLETGRMNVTGFDDIDLTPNIIDVYK